WIWPSLREQTRIRRKPEPGAVELPVSGPIVRRRQPRRVSVAASVSAAASSTVTPATMLASATPRVTRRAKRCAVRAREQAARRFTFGSLLVARNADRKDRQDART